MVELAHEADRVTTRAAAETFEEPQRHVDVERWGLLVVEGTEPLHPSGAGGTKLDVVADDLVEWQPLTDRGNDLVTDPSGHAPPPQVVPVLAGEGAGPWGLVSQHGGAG